MRRDREAIMKACGISFDSELAAEGGEAYELAAEPEPLYFETLIAAVENFSALMDRECNKLEARAEAAEQRIAELTEENVKLSLELAKLRVKLIVDEEAKGDDNVPSGNF